LTTFAGSSTTNERIATLIAERTPGYALPGPFYLDQEVFDLDVAAVFATHWIFVATEAEVPEPGDFVTVEIGPYSVIIVREDDGVRALHNVCRHRGARVLLEPRGSVGNLVCGYHQWTYSTDGSLLHAGSQAPDFDPNCFGLKRVNVRSVSGLIFVCLADEPPSDFDDVARRIAPYLTAHQLHRTKVAAQEDIVEHGNWKLVMENNRECYHCDGSHPELSATFFPTYGYPDDQIPPRLRTAHARYVAAEAELEALCSQRNIPFARIEELAGRPTGFRIQREALDGAGESFTRDGSAACQRLVGDFDTARMGRLSLHVQPNTWLHFLSDHAFTSTALPISADRTLVRTRWLVHEDAVEGVDYDVEKLTDVWRHTNAQDSALVARAHVGISSPAYRPGPYAPGEYQVDEFVSWYLSRLEAHIQR
jgi:glycine betaine monooxygenase A